MKPSVGLVSASAKNDGISFDGRMFRWALDALGFPVVWYQCVDRGVDAQPQPGDRVVRGQGFPSATVDMGLNRLWTFPRRLRSVSEDILFLMDPTLINAARARPGTVVRVHDLKPLTKFADRTASTWMFRYAIPRLRMARRILVPTQSTATELAQYRIPSDLVRVVPETHSLGFHPEHIGSSLEHIRTTGTIRALYVATDRPPKNLQFVFRLAQRMGPTREGRRFEFTVLSRLRPETRALISDLRLTNLSILSEVASIADVYRAHDLLVFPSLHEGFGRPVIEAMAFGMPVIASDIPALREVIGDPDAVLSPATIEPWEVRLRQLADPGAYESAARRSFSRGEEFAPERFRDSVGTAFEGL